MFATTECLNETRVSCEKAARPVVVTLTGSPGCGKTEILISTARLLGDSFRLGVILANQPTVADVKRVKAVCSNVVTLPSRSWRVGNHRAWETSATDGVPELILIEENSAEVPVRASSASVETDPTLRVGIFSVAAGDNKAARDPDHLHGADLLLLTKTDLLAQVSFDVEQFRVDAANRSAARLLEISPRSGAGMGPWLQWLRDRVTRRRAEAGGIDAHPECFLG